jgi:hypothetical protein
MAIESRCFIPKENCLLSCFLYAIKQLSGAHHQPVLVCIYICGGIFPGSLLPLNGCIMMVAQ